MEYKRSLTSTVYVVNRENGKVLLHLHRKYTTYFPPGGHFEPGELPHETAIREVREETGFDVTLLRTAVSEKFDTGLVEDIPTPFRLYREGIGSEEEFLDFNYIALTDETNPHPEKSESRNFVWLSREELENSGEVKIHIKNTALAVLDYLKSNGYIK